MCEIHHRDRFVLEMNCVNACMLSPPSSLLWKTNLLRCPNTHIKDTFQMLDMFEFKLLKKF